LLSDWLHIPHISTGQLLRSEAASGSEPGSRVKALMEAGGLVSDDIVEEILAVRTAKDDCKSGFILDGYPRDLRQAASLRRMLRRGDRFIVIDIDTDLSRIIPRLTGRRTCSSCNSIYHLSLSPPRQPGLCDACGGRLTQRADDREDVIRERFKTYRAMTKPLTEHYYREGVYRRVDGMQPPEKVAQDIRRLVEFELAAAPAASEAAPETSVS
jgi:adenylate kinase